MNTEIELSVILVNYNTATHIDKCLASIYENTSGLNYEIIIVDNNSSDRAIEKLPNKYPDVNLYFNNKNNGFGAGCNYGAEKAKGKYIAFINPDIFFTNNALKELIKYLDEHPETGFCSGAFTDNRGNYIYTYNTFPSYFWEFIEAVGIGSNLIINNLINKLEEQSKIREDIQVDWIYGACMIIPAKVFHDANGFDESFFLFYEDVDLQLRINSLGYKIICIPKIRIYHETNVSTKDNEIRNKYYIHMNRSKLIYMYKHFGFIKRNIIKLIHIAGLLVRKLVLPFRKKFRNVKSSKLAQYNIILKLYTMNYDSLLHYRYN